MKVEELIRGRQKTRNHGYDVIVGELFTDCSITLASLTLNPKNSNQQAPDATSFFPVGGMPTASAKRPERLLSESRAAVALQQIKERGALPMIDRGDIRQAIDRCSNMDVTAGRWLWFERADSLIAFKEAGGTVREIDV